MRLDRELVQRYRLEPRTAREEKALALLDATDFSIYSTKLELMCEEGKELMTKTGISGMMQAGDCIVGVYTASGDLGLACVGTCLHAATGQIPMKYIVKNYLDDPTVGVRDGDNFFTNEAQLGGIHNPDQVNSIPIYWDGQLIAWVAAASHEPETGASEPGGTPTNGSSRWDEGFKTPPLKVGENFAMKSDVMNMIANMVRDHRMIEVDMRARSAACLKVRERLLELIAEKGPDFVVGLLRRSCEAASDGMRSVISEMIDGTYRTPMFSDNIGKDEGLVRVMIAVVKKDDTITIDLRGCSPQTPSVRNAPTHVVRAHMAAMLSMYLVPDMPCSSGMYQNFEFIPAENGTCLNPSMDAGISNSIQIGAIATQGMHACLNKAMFGSGLRDRVAVPFGTGVRGFVGAGTDQYGHYGAFISSSSANVGGGGARPEMDGVDSAGFWWTGWGDALDIEQDELQHPYLISFRMLAPDQAGLGKYRGGAGCTSNTIIHGCDDFYGVVLGSWWRFPTAIGQFGGYAASCGPVLTVEDAQWQEALATPGFETPRNLLELANSRPVDGRYTIRSMGPGQSYKNGDSIGLIGVAGGGYGDALDRDPQLVMTDLQRGIYSTWTVKNVFHVAYDPETLTVDPEGTKALRQQERVARLIRGKPYKEFVREWATVAPPAEALKYYGTWPHPNEPTDRQSVQPDVSRSDALATPRV